MLGELEWYENPPDGKYRYIRTVDPRNPIACVYKNYDDNCWWINTYTEYNTKVGTTRLPTTVPITEPAPEELIEGLIRLVWTD